MNHSTKFDMAGLCEVQEADGTHHCKECVLVFDNRCPSAPCLPSMRNGGGHVSYRFAPAPAAYSTPCDDMGTPMGLQS